MQLPDGQKAELGATWLHGIHGHPVYNLAVEYGLMSAEPTKGELIFSMLLSVNRQIIYESL